MKTPLLLAAFLFLSPLPASAADTPATQPAPQQPPAATPQPPQDTPWSPPVHGYRFRLSTDKTTFESWQSPSFTLEVLCETNQPLLPNNANGNPLPFNNLQNILQNPNQRGSGFIFDPDLPQTNPYFANVTPGIRIDYSQFSDLKPGQSRNQTVTFTGILPSNKDAPLQPLPPGPHSITILDARTGAKSNSLTLHILPPGPKTQQDLDKLLKPLNAFGTPILAGFVPNKTTVVIGEPVFLTLYIQNPNKKPFQFAFGGDYRGSGRHDRFKITGLDQNNKPLADPSQHPDMGGIVSNRTALPQAPVAITVSIPQFRTIPGPGKYKISAAFPLPDTFDKEYLPNHKPVPINFTYELTVLPRTPENVDRTLKQLFEQAAQTQGPSLDSLLKEITTFASEPALNAIIKMASPATKDPAHRVAAAKALAAITTPDSLKALLALLDDKDPAVRKQVLSSLGAFSDNAAVDALIQEYVTTDTAGCAAILRAMGQGKSPRAFPFIVRCLDDENNDIRLAALDATINFPVEDAAPVLRKHASSNPNMDFREDVASALGQYLRQPLEAQWLAPILEHRKKSGEMSGDVGRLLRLYCPDDAALTLLSALNFDDPSPRSSFNSSLIYDQLVCTKSLVIPWIHELNAQPTPAQIQENTRILRVLKIWVAWQQKNPIKLPKDHDGNYQRWLDTWSDPVNDLSIRAMPRIPVWPAGLPQYIRYELRKPSTQDQIDLRTRTDLPRLELEIDSHWYTLAPGADLTIPGDWGRGYATRNHELQLDSRWLSKSDKTPLNLKPGNHTLRVAYSPTPADKTPAFIISKPITIQIIPSE